MALLINSSNFEHQQKVIQELHRVFKERGGYALYVFTCHGLILSNSGRYSQDFSIYNLVETDIFDGYIIEGRLGNNFKLLYKIADRIAKKHIPIVTLNCDMENIPCIQYDSYDATVQMLEHLITVHHCTRINLDTNMIDQNFDSDEALTQVAYKDTLQKYDIPFEEARVTNEAVSIKNGQSLYYQMKRLKTDDAEAILFSHDVKAIGLCMELETQGKKVPEDVILCSTKRSTNSIVYRPDISGTDPNQAGGAEVVVNTLEAVFEGREVPHKTFYRGNAVFGRSCSCCKQEPFDVPSDFRRLILSKIEAGNQIGRMMQYNAKLENVASFEELSNNVKEILTGISLNQFVVCINKWDLSPKASENDEDHSKPFDDTLCVLSSALSNGTLNYLQEFPLKSLIPVEPDDGDIAIFMPMLFKSHVYGYIAFLNEYLPIEQYNYRVCHDSISGSIDALRHDIYLRSQGQTDPLTGLSNNFALKQFKANNEKCKDFGIIMIDMDNLKHINDNYGHSVGNIAICTISEAIKSRKNALSVRYGGDEFVIASFKTDPLFYEREIAEIRTIISENAAKQLLPFDLGVSAGYYISSTEAPMAFDEVMKNADSAMYADKRRRKGLK